MKDIVVGIDLGTTNSCISYLKDGKPVTVQVEDSSAIMPSVVSYDENENKILAGKEALNRLCAFPNHTVRSIKRLMGKEQSVTLGSRSYKPEEISSFILKELVDRASKITGLEMKKAVITVPAYFNDAQRRATITAGELSGLEVLRIVNEPTAASLVYDYLSRTERTDSPYILVYDLGGGTFDVSILEVKGEIKEVLASGGDTALGGDDFDDRLVELFLRSIKRKTGFDLSIENRQLYVRLKDIAERTKIQLSDKPYVSVKEASVVTAAGEPVNLDIEVSRPEYEQMISDLVKKTIDKVEETIKEAHLSIDNIGDVLLVGGATRTPIVQQFMSEFFNRTINHSIDPDLCVSLGAAVQGGLILGEPLGHILLDVSAHSLGMKTADRFDYETGEADYFSVIIRRNTKIPARKADVHYTMYDQQEGVEYEVYQGESPSCRNNTLIGEFYFSLKPAPNNSPVTTEFAYDKEGIVHITVEQKGYNNRKEVTLDVRSKKIIDKQKTEEEQKILNYIVEKYKKLLENNELSEQIKEELKQIGDEYEQALKKGTDDDKIDDLEDKLLEKIEQAEEELENIE
ncbi:molecular chaperone DnaK [Candidatus Magnetoovum chiemensis]|nr:molecular chaperone DnaK [Candidatus Magnetoovum chiemensis]